MTKEQQATEKGDKRTVWKRVVTVPPIKKEIADYPKDCKLIFQPLSLKVILRYGHQWHFKYNYLFFIYCVKTRLKSESNFILRSVVIWMSHGSYVSRLARQLPRQLSSSSALGWWFGFQRTITVTEHQDNTTQGDLAGSWNPLYHEFSKV